MPHASTTEYHPWRTFMAARQEAQRIGDRRIGTDHLLLGLLREPEVAKFLDVTLEDARRVLASLDRDALFAIGLERVPVTPDVIDQPIPARPSMKLVIGSHMKMSPAAKTALQEAGRPLRHRRTITANAVLAALLENDVPDPAATLLKALHLDRRELRARLEGE
jgi:ATP-dependent Clp protease ATP-binding subunit ClpA